MSVSITKKPLLPNVKIEKNDASFYTFNHFAGTYNFRLRGLTCTPPKDNQKGHFSIRLTSANASNTDANTILSNIKRGNEVQIWIGKTDPGTSDSSTRLFLGRIETLEIYEHTASFMDIEISGPDWGSDILKSRIVNRNWTQIKTGDGITLDTTDETTLIQQIVLDLLTEANSYAAGEVPVGDATGSGSTQGIVVTAANIQTPDIKLPAFVANYERLDDKLSELDSIGGTIHWVGPDKVFHMELPVESTSSRPAEILITDDYTNATAIAWPPGQTKVGLIGTDCDYKITVENKKSRYFGIGGGVEEVDQSKETNASSTTLNGQYIGMKFTPTKIFLEGVALYLGKTGDPPTSSVTCMIYENKSNEPVDLLCSARIDEKYVTASGGWVTFKMQTELNTANSYWIILQKNPGDDVSNCYKWYRDSASTGVSGTSSDGDTWTIDATGFNYMYRTYTTYPLVTIVSDPNNGVLTSKHFHEEVIFKNDITIHTVLNKLLTGESNTGFKEKEMLKCRIYAPDTILSAGQKIRVIKTASGKSISTAGTPSNDDFILSDVTYTFESTNEGGTGTFWYDAELIRFVSYT